MALSFNWVFLVELLGCCILTLCFLFYFNRFFATLVSYALRTYTWHKYRAHVEVQALQFSLLAGRIFFKDLRYHGTNETILIHGGHVTWRYWLRKVRAVDCSTTRAGAIPGNLGTKDAGVKAARSDHTSDNETGGVAKITDDLPCRIAVSARGLEWFVYNRTPAYDAIVASMSRADEGPCSDLKDANDPGSPPLGGKGSSSSTAGHARHPPVDRMQSESAPVAGLLDFLPIYIECSKGGIVLGNENTRTILTAKFDRASGHVDATHSRPVDLYKQMINLEITQPLVQIRTNLEFQQSQLSAAARLKREGHIDTHTTRARRHHHGHNRHNPLIPRIGQTLKHLSHFFRISNSSSPSAHNSLESSTRRPSQDTQQGEDRWLGLSRYLRGDGQDEQDGWKSVEYAKVSTIVDCPSVSTSLYWDVPGFVPERSSNDTHILPEYRDDINCDSPPDWGIDLRVRGGDIRYGPWTDRERADLQAIFFPNPYNDAVPAAPLKAGQLRVSTVFRLRIDIEQPLTIRLPFREESKDWKWEGKANVVRDTREQENQREKKRWGIGKKGDKGAPGPEVRPFGWLDIKIQPDSTITYTMDMFPRAKGFRNGLEIDLRGTEMSSSVNHGLLWRSVSQTILCDLSNPLAWNALHQWSFDVVTNGLELFILRDHIFLLIDLITDWTSGPPADFYTFVPFQYRAKLAFPNFKLYLNANDSNIINNPSDLEDNTFVTVWGENLFANIDIPMKKYRSTQNVIGFDVDAQNGGFELRTPLWNTQNTFVNNKYIAFMSDLAMKGSYAYYNTNSPSQTDTLLLDVDGENLNVHLYGFFVRYLMKLKDNYFGDDLHFRTLEEYQSILLNQGSYYQAYREELEGKSSKKTNDLDVILSIAINDTCALLPANLYCAEESVKIDLASLIAELRFTNYYMDLEVNLSPLLVSPKSVKHEEGSLAGATLNTQVFIDAVDIYGHRLFGLPPAEPTYVCNWDFRVGAVDGECSTDFVRTLALALRCFGFSFEDNENALPSIHAKDIHDVTFLRANVEPTRVWLLVDQTAILVSTGALSFDFNDWARMDHSEVLSLVIPALTLACVDMKSATYHRSKAPSSMTTLAYLQTSINLSMIGRKGDFEQHRELQQNHIRVHDQRTRRTEWLLHTEDEQVASILPGVHAKMNAPAMPFPPMPEPAAMEREAAFYPASISSKSNSVASRPAASRNRSTSSFLSLEHTYGTSSSGKPKRRRHEPRAFAFERNPITNAVITNDHLTSTTRWTSRSPSTHRGAESMTRQVQVEHGEHTDYGCALSRIPFTNFFETPHFTLRGAVLDLSDVPKLPECATSYRKLRRSTLSSEDESILDENDKGMQTSFIITLDSGVRCFCSSKAVYSILALLGHLQPKDPVSVLDCLQLDVMSEIMGYAKKKLRINKTTDVTFRVSYAHLRFVNPWTLPSDGKVEEGRDRCNVILSRCRLTARTTVKATNEDHVEDGGNVYTVHLALGSLSFAIEEPLSRASTQCAAVRADVGDVEFWVVSGQSLSANLCLKDIGVMTVGKKLEYLVSLIQRTIAHGSGVAKSIERAKEQQTMRLRHLAFALTMLGASVPDPPFLTRPSYVLRSARGHTRVNDSWKILSRFRCMYHGLSEHQKAEMIAQCKMNDGQCPSDAVSQVSKCFDGWRSWELVHVRESQVIRNLFGVKPKIAKSNVPKPQSISAAATVGRIRLAIDPGPKQSELTIDALAICTTANTPSIPATDLALKAPTPYMTVVQVHCNRFAIDLHWQLWELFEDVQRLYPTSEAHTQTPLDPLPATKPASRRMGHYHVLLTADKGRVRVDSINLRLINRCDGIESSFVTAEHPGLENRRLVNVLVQAQVASSEFLSHTKTLAALEAQRPRICASHKEQSVVDATPAVWTLAGLCQGILCDVPADLPTMIGVVDLLINEEVADMHHILPTLKERPASRTPAMAALTTKAPRVIVTLALEKYQLKLAVLSAFVYTITGNVARSSVVVKPDRKAVIDVDLKGQSHSLDAELDGKTRRVSVLDVPPINWHVRLTSRKVHTSVEVYMAVEPTRLDASALHSLLDILSSSETSMEIQDVCHEFKGIRTRFQNNFQDVSEPSQKVVATKSSGISKPVLYDIHLTLTETSVRAVVPVGSSDVSAHMDLSFGCVQLEASNKSEDGNGVLEHAELSLGVRNILLQLRSSGGPDTQACGTVSLALSLSCTSRQNRVGDNVRSYHLKVRDFNTDLFPDTAATVIAVFGDLQDKVKGLDLSGKLGSLRKRQLSITPLAAEKLESKQESGKLFSSMYSLEVLDIQVNWVVGNLFMDSGGQQSEDLILSVTKIDLATKKENAARLVIEGFRLQMVPTGQNRRERSLNSALLPEVVFNVAYLSTKDDRRLAFQAAGKSLDLRLTTQFVIPASNLQRSIASATQKCRTATAKWAAKPIGSDFEKKDLLGNKRLASLLIDADFAGAVVHIQGRRVPDSQNSALSVPHSGRLPQHGRYGQFTHDDASSSTTLRAPGIALKVEYNDNGNDDPSLNAEIKVDASSNKIYPTVVPLIMEISSSIQNVVRKPEDIDIASTPQTSSQKFLDDEKLRAANPSAILGKCKLNVGLQIRRQEFSLSCQPIARVAAIAHFEDIYITVNTVQSTEHNRFFAVSATFSKLQASLQHVYSRESTGYFDVESIVLSLMNSRHVSDANGIAAILRISPMTAQINAKQLQDYLLFREIWMPAEIRQSPERNTPKSVSESQMYNVQRYQHMASAGAFPWNATISVAALNIHLDMGQALGKSAFTVSDFWISTKKTSDWEQNLCLGFQKFAVNSSGRMSGLIELQNCRIRTYIRWPLEEKAVNQAPLVQASIGFDELKVKAAFEYQAFLITDISTFEFFMYNVRNTTDGHGDRLVGILDGGKVQIFCTSTSASQGLALYQAFQRLAQEKRVAYESSLKDIEKFLRRKSTTTPAGPRLSISQPAKADIESTKTPISLHTDVMVTLRAVNIGMFPSTFFDNQVFKFEALNAEANFAVVVENDRVHSGLGLTLGQLRVALSSVGQSNAAKSPEEVAVEDVVNSVTGSRGGTILKVPRVIANMETWQSPESNHIDYKFTSSFEGKVDVGWNYSRIRFIRTMWANHSRSLAQRLGKPLGQSAVQITGGPLPEMNGEEGVADGAGQEKITAVVNVPQSRYDYTALEPPIIETPQLRDMGEATPPLEWIGLQRDRLPHLTHQLIIVTLLEVAKEVEDAYCKILGSS